MGEGVEEASLRGHRRRSAFVSVLARWARLEGTGGGAPGGMHVSGRLKVERLELLYLLQQPPVLFSQRLAALSQELALDFGFLELCPATRRSRVE